MSLTNMNGIIERDAAKWIPVRRDPSRGKEKLRDAAKGIPVRRDPSRGKEKLREAAKGIPVRQVPSRGNGSCVMRRRGYRCTTPSCDVWSLRKCLCPVYLMLEQK